LQVRFDSIQNSSGSSAKPNAEMLKLGKQKAEMDHRTTTVIDKVAMECGGKRSATPLWLRVALLLHQRITVVRETGVALRLPPHSPSMLPGHPGETARSQSLPGFEVPVDYLFRGEQ
jgi:hypothetical protein